ncbi:hypothetical protein N0V88_004838 [Collariella sp. IMI 366227]|nr:hypothetical protein N0V88_004838 [Collariella sp. IMI 366227]
MCFQEFLAYQCGHRSMAVVRTCPMTTAGHNFPICSIKPDKIYYAETMCAPCERQLHSRWVLIREWEHRWLHERGACGCEVTFPGLLHTTRVIGETDLVEGSQSTTDQGHLALLSTEEHQNESSMSKALVVSAESSRAESRLSIPRSTASDGHKKIPAIFTETITEDQHRIAIRLPSLYAAEWQADHRALHEAGKCSCPIDFAPFRPQIPDEELTPEDREVLRQFREMEEAANVNSQNNAPDHSQLDPEAERIAGIHKAFGAFTMEGESSRANTQGLPLEQVQMTGYGAEQGAAAAGDETGRGKMADDEGVPPQQQQFMPAIPLCGLPMGAGSEGVSHMPSWMDCRLRTGGASERVEKEGEGDAASGSVEVMSISLEEIEAGKAEEGGIKGQDLGGRYKEEGGELATPSPPPRRHSAST